jgi:hypothetical protein
MGHEFQNWYFCGFYIFFSEKVSYDVILQNISFLVETISKFLTIFWSKKGQIYQMASKNVKT